MGIKDLLVELKPLITKCHISHFSGQTVGVDVSCWLHKAAYGSSLEILHNIPTNKYIECILGYIRLLQSFDISVILVFDGDTEAMMKKNENLKRRELRQKCKEKAMCAHRVGDKENLWKYACGAISISTRMKTKLIAACHRNDIKFVVAPFEADAQLGYMYVSKQIDFVISEDSDLILYGVEKCVFKWNKNKDGNGDFFNFDKIKYYEPNTIKMNDLCYFMKQHKDKRHLINICVLSGCDYIQRLPLNGLKTCVKLYRKCNQNIYDLLNLQQSNQKKKMPKDYKMNFHRAVLTFHCHRVYDEKTMKLRHFNALTMDICKPYLNELKKEDQKFNFLGYSMNDELAKDIAQGFVIPGTHKRRILHYIDDMLQFVADYKFIKCYK